MNVEKVEPRKASFGSDLQTQESLPGRSLAPPPFELKTEEDEKGEQKEGNFLGEAIGKKGANNPKDLRKLGTYLLQAGAPLFLVAKLMDPSENGIWIERYQKEVLGWKRTDGTADPDGTTIKAMLALQGREIVESWFQPQNEVAGESTEEKVSANEGQSAKGSGRKAEKGMASIGRKKDIPTVLSASQYFSAYTQAGQSVPLSFLKSNMGTYATESGYRDSGCYQTCRYTLIQAGFTPGDKSTTKYMVEAGSKGEKGTKGFQKWIKGPSAEFDAGKSRLDALLEAKKPAIIGVNRDDQNTRWTNTHRDGGVSPSDHYVIVVGRMQLEDGSTAYQYYDPARWSVAKGTSPQNLLIVKNGMIKAEGYDNFTYTMSEVRNTTQK
ncbi:MAG: hypothetical protein H6581_31595 [Bacteroidia bacterium]|nr:hypothetical protein [Bacteroidia bacterium]